MKEFGDSEKGQAILLTVLCLAVLLGFAALAVDVGVFFHAKRNLQIAADAGATAGALDYYHTVSSSSAITAATNAATANGFTSGTGTVVTVTTPVASGGHTGAEYVQVDITKSNATAFMNIFGISSVNVSATAVAGSVAPQACIFTNYLNVKGSAIIEGWNTATNTAEKTCGIYAKNNVNVTGAGNKFNVTYVETSGTLTGNQDIVDSPVVTGAPPQTPPPALQITPPAPSSYSSCNPPAGYTLPTTGKNKGIISATLSGTISPGCYGLGGTTATAMNIDLGGLTTTMLPGLYVFDLGTGGTLTLGNNVSGGQAAQGSPGVTLDVNTGNFAVTSTTNDSLYAPSDGSTGTSGYDGVLLLEPTTNTGTINFQWGSSSGNWYGYIVAPGATVTMQDQGGSPLISGLYVGTLTINGTLNIDDYGKVYSNSPMRSIALVQ